MKILFLGPLDSPLLGYLRSREDEVFATAEAFDAGFLDARMPDFLVSYGYPRILKQPILERFMPDRAINLHISYLPWNRGSDPNFWSFLERTPKGVTIHYLDEGIDTGDIIVRKEVAFGASETLKSSYDRLHEEIEALFYAHWPAIRSGACPRLPQTGAGSFHLYKETKARMHLLSDGWNTPVNVLEEAGVTSDRP